MRRVGVFAVAATIGVALSVDVASGRPILGSRWGLLVRLGLWAAAWIVAAWCALRLPRRIALVVIVVAAAALRLGALAGPPSTSDDLYRYAWDGRVQQAGVDPYDHPPSSPALAHLRDAWLWPDPAGCRALHRDPGCTRINRPTVRTIYPPAAEAWFTLLGGIGAKHKTWQVAGLVVDMATIGGLVVLLRRRGGDERLVAWYALSPIPVLEFVNNAHVDGLAVGLAVAAFAVWYGRGRVRWRDIAFGLLIGGAALVKVYPAVLLLAVGGPWARRLRAALAAGALVVVAYAPHVLAAGVRVVGYLPGYLREEHYQQGGRFLLAGALGLSGHLAAAASAGIVLGAAGWVVLRRPDPLRAATVLLAALFAATTPVQPWYAASLVAFGAAAGVPGVAAIAVAGYPYFFAVILDYRHTVGLGRLVYAAGVLIAVASRRSQSGQVEGPATVEATVAAGSRPRGEHGPQRAVAITEDLEAPR